MKKVLICLLALSCLILSGCDILHTHSYDMDYYVYDEEFHWQQPTCEHQDALKDKGAHTLNSDSVCTVCGYKSDSTANTNIFVEGNFRGEHDDVVYYLDVKLIDSEDFCEDDNILRDESQKAPNNCFEVNLRSFDNDSLGATYYNFGYLQNVDGDSNIFADENGNSITPQVDKDGLPSYAVKFDNAEIQFSVYEIVAEVDLNNYEQVITRGVAAAVKDNAINGSVRFSDKDFFICENYQITVEYEVVSGSLVIAQGEATVNKGENAAFPFTYEVNSTDQGQMLIATLSVRIISAAGSVEFDDELLRRLFIN